MCLGETCGAISGAIIALGLMAYKVLEPRTEYEQKITCQAVTPYIRDLAYNFNFVFGSIHCAILKRDFEKTPAESDIYYRTKLGKDVCAKFVDFAVRKMVSWGEVSQEPGKRVPSGTPLLKLG